MKKHLKNWKNLHSNYSSRGEVPRSTETKAITRHGEKSREVLKQIQRSNPFLRRPAQRSTIGASNVQCSLSGAGKLRNRNWNEVEKPHISALQWRRGQFQRLHPCFGVARLNGTGANTVQSWFPPVLENCGLVAGMKWKSHISQHCSDIDGQFWRLHLCFGGRPTQLSWYQHCPRLISAGAGKLWTRSWNEVEKQHNYISTEVT